MEIQKLSGNSVSAEYDVSPKKNQKIKFNLDNRYLKCFMSERKSNRSANHQEKISLIFKNQRGLEGPHIKPLTFSLRKKGQEISQQANPNSQSFFNHKLLIIQYDQEQFIGNNIINKQRTGEITQDVFAIEPMLSHKSYEKSHVSQFNPHDNIDENIIASCLRVITQQTDNTSNPSKDTVICNYQNYNNFYPYYQSYSYNYYQPSNINTEIRQQDPSRTKNKKTISNNEGQLFQIVLENIEKDGRTTLMLRNIPNKYTRDMILDEINSYHDFKKKYDFFYLPIDYRNQCNVGYAFINLIHTKFIPQFYQKFHLKKWQKFNSEKICNLCYARIQGTAQLLSHFKDSNVLQQKDKKIRPIIDFKDNSLAEIVERQRNQTSNLSLD